MNIYPVPAEPIGIQDVHTGPPLVPSKPFGDSNRLAPGNAFFPQPPPRLHAEAETISRTLNEAPAAVSSSYDRRRKRDKDRGRSGSRRGKGEWKKLLWVKQPKYPDNYTDPPTFLSHLQRNPRLQPYDFWPLVADSTVIVQHLASVTIFVCCFVGINREQFSPVSMVSLGSAGTILGWVLWDFWVGQSEAAKMTSRTAITNSVDLRNEESDHRSNRKPDLNHSRPPSRSSETSGLGLTLVPSDPGHKHHSQSTHHLFMSPISSELSSTSSTTNLQPVASFSTSMSPSPGYRSPINILSQRNQQRLTTMKSAVLIYCVLHGLSPILKSLTKSTSPDSIWALSTMLMCINILFFDYGGGVGVKFPASLSTNAALMSSTVLASRLPSTTHVFSLTLFSIEVFGLFPVFRRHLRHVSWRGHLVLTLVLVLGAGGVSGITLSKNGGWQAMLLGMVFWSVGAALGMGGCSWWLIGLQRYKNVVVGPWDPARPVIRGGGWE
ncbi:MAG: hypothetical protein LQ349_005985 [Xanthoria aureola]|nr:MAG: hypothetical protein LQ349_005985 [Xanthoria aureola]